MIDIIAVSFVSDIHSNLEALQAVLADIDNKVEDEVETKIFCLGDIVGYGASPNEVITLLNDNRVTCISGNHDQAALSGDTTGFNATAAEAVFWTFRHLDSNSMEFLKMLPLDAAFKVGGKRVYLVHGSPDNQLWEYARVETHEVLFGSYLTRVHADVLGLGHTHLPFVWRGPEGLVFNPGSVGQPRDGDSRASYATLTLDDSGGIELLHRRVDYDVGTAAQKITDSGLPLQLGDRLFIGR
ncbi:MAG TPA: metallophosphoesterase family protein [Nitrososphaerales archaeon]|nr:metallophosphoesterase family protein [Nitrososphaerales archaeon]